MSTSYSDFFDLRKDWVPPSKPVPLSAKKFLQKVKEVEEQAKSTVAAARSAPQLSSTAYAQAYREQEELEYLQARSGDSSGSAFASQVSASSMMEDISETTSIADMSEADYFDGDDESLRVYSRYDFTCRKQGVQNLAIFQQKNAILAAVEANQVVIIEGYTGCGKTTQVPQYILDDSYRKNKVCNIAVTQPRRVAAISIAERVCEERQWEVGKVVGYQVALDKCTSEDTRITYMTTGVILEFLVKKKSFQPYTHLIIDEVHERDKDTDFLMIVVKMLMKKNPFVKIILMSATINADQFARYFTLPSRNRHTDYDEPPIISVTALSNSNYPVLNYYLDDLIKMPKPKARMGDPEILEKIMLENPTILEEQYFMGARVIIMLDQLEKDILTSQREHIIPGAAVLVFLPGIHEIQMMEKMLEEQWEEERRRRNDDEMSKLEILPLHSTITSSEQKRAFKPVGPGRRKVILSTNIAESSVTVTDIVYVVDFCLSKQLQTDKETNYCSLKMEWASRNAIHQRAGRCGRVSSGRVYRMIPRRFQTDKYLPEETTPELLRCPLEQSVLRAKELEFGKPEKVLALALDPPFICNIRACILSLKEVGAMLMTSGGKIDPDDGDLTVVGRIMGRLPLDIRLSKLIVLGYVFNVLEECVIMAAGLSAKSIFSYPYRYKTQAYCSKYKWAQETYSDPLATLNAYTDWERRSIANEFARSGSTNREAKYCSENFLQLKQLREMKNLVLEIQKRLEQFNIKAGRPPSDFRWTEYERQLILKIVIAGACFPYYFSSGRSQNEEVWTEARKELDGRDPKTAVLLQGFPLNQSSYGELYVQKILDLLRTSRLLEDDEKGALEKINIHFIRGSSKLVVDFKDTAPMSDTSVNYYVRKAVKMRQDRVPLPLYVKSQEEAAVSHKKWQQDKEKLMKNMDEGGREIVYASLLEELPLPYVTKSEMLFSLAHVENPGCFFLNYQEGEPRKQLSLVYSTLNPGHRRDFSPLKQTPVSGQLVIVPYEGDYYRARVDSVPRMLTEHSRVGVTFIDYGNQEFRSPRELYDLDDDLRQKGLFRIPALALRCALAHVKPPVRMGNAWKNRSPSGKIDEENESDVMFALLESMPGIRGRVFSVVDGVVRLEILLPASVAIEYGRSMCLTLNQMLVERNLAHKFKESQASLQNHEYRVLAGEDRMPASDIDRVQQNQRGVVSEFKGPIRDLGACSERVNLVGPRSPIEARLSSLASKGNKVVSIDPESVNSVLFEEQNEQPTERLLVAMHVSMTQDGRRLMARNTTVLPAVPGLCAVVSLLFASAMEFRTDAKESRFTGAVCGLGYRQESGHSEALFADHDLELAFDVQITNEDIRLIDKIRYRMNDALAEESGSQGLLSCTRHKLQKIHSEIATFLFGSNRLSNESHTIRPGSYLLNPERKPIIVEHCRLPGRWNLLRSENVLVASKGNSGDGQEIYQLHNGYDLTVFARHPRELHQKMNALENLMNVLSIGVPARMETFSCPICDFVASNYGEIAAHMRSREHKEMEIVYQNLPVG